MINIQMRNYDYFTLGKKDAYGQQVLSDYPTGTIKMSINITSQSIQDNINYKDCAYIGLTSASINDKYVIEYEGAKLKVLYVNPKGRLKQVFLAEL
jgi:hypothetical protein